jgi:hypothetical protein
MKPTAKVPSAASVPASSEKPGKNWLRKTSVAATP